MSKPTSLRPPALVSTVWLRTLSRACDIDIEKTYTLLRSLRLTMLLHVRELWLTVMERRHAKDNTEQRNLVKEDGLRVKRLLARMVNAKGKAMPDWRVVRKQPIYSIRASLGRWKKVKRKRIAAGGQTAIAGFFRAAPRAPGDRTGGVVLQRARVPNKRGFVRA